jgi:alkylation response protein AidB-like acyl-CoA dehydrogenase
MSETCTLGAEFLRSTPGRIFTVEDFSSDERLMVETAEQFSRERVLPQLELMENHESDLPKELVTEAGALGLCGVDSPEEYGGLGLSKNLAARILEFLSLDGSFSVTFGITSGIAQAGLALFGSEDQKARYLPRLASGEWMGAYALSEANSGSDALSATTRADDMGDHYLLNGAKMWISNARWADLFLVMAKVGGEKFSAFLVERDFPGVSVAREEHKLGLRASSTARLVLENAIVPKENLLYVEGLGHHVALNALNLGRFKLSSMSMGPARHSMELASAYAMERQQFKTPIGKFGLIEQKFAQCAALFFACEAMVYRTGALVDEAFASFGGPIDGNRTAAERFSIECSACKVFSTEAEAQIVDECLQVFGGYGFTEEFPIARHYRDARISRIYEGTNEINRVFIGDRLLKRARSESLSPAEPDSFVSELWQRGLNLQPEHQAELGAFADLAILVYAEQSARLRAAQLGPLAGQVLQVLTPMLNVRAATALQVLTGEAVALPESEKRDWTAVAQAVYGAKGPLPSHLLSG